ncbi:MAG: hypothetical protein E7051_02460 [Lentisphaerae bacterium]|nr:hypothetical protein [Lentisphaerota bacterium]MBQ4328111.1 hypothetical protein [Lentisphaeria bacterium]
MTTYEWLGLIVVLIGGFWKLSSKLTKIEVALSGKVGFEDCSERQGRCTCHKKVETMEKLMEKLHPHQR